MVFGSQIRAARALIGLKQAELAKAAGLSTTAIKNIETGQTDAKQSTIRRIEDALRERGVAFFEADQDGGPGVRLIRH
jgi:transcriptional regulator with XRE-family HTH domain